MNDHEGRLVDAALRCYPARWRQRHAAEAAEVAELLIRDGVPAASIAWSYLIGAAREWLTPRSRRSLGTVAAALLAATCLAGFSAALLAGTGTAKAAGPPRRPPPRRSRPRTTLGHATTFCPGTRMSVPADPDPARTDPASAGAGETGSRRGKRWWRRIAETVIMVLIALLVSALVRSYAFAMYWIPSGSMIPTLSVNDRILVQKAFFGPQDIREGDIVVFSNPRLDVCGGVPAGDLVKRVIALPGQTIYSAGNSIYINGHLLPEPYLPAHDPLGPPIASRRHPYRVPAGDFYVLGDNRADSCDSRYWGPVQGSRIIGKALMIVWHNNHPDLHGL
jgi:signal peptidase I